MNSKQKVLFVLLDEYTDWEGAFLSTALHVGVIPGSEVKYSVIQSVIERDFQLNSQLFSGS